MAAYSFQDVNAQISGTGGGFALSEGGVSDEGIVVSMREDKGTMDVGADGEGQHSLHAANSGVVTVRLFKENPINALLGQLYATQAASSAAWGSNTIVIRNPTRGDTITCTQGAFRKMPDNVNAKAAGIMEWGFNFIRIIHVLGDGTPG